MSLGSYRTFQALIMAGSGLGLLLLVLDGHVLDYIHPSLGILVFIAALALIILAQFVLRERPSEAESGQHESGDRPAWGLWLAALPLLVGLLIPDPHFASGAEQTPSMTLPAVEPAAYHAALSSSPEMSEDVQKSGPAGGDLWVLAYDSGFIRLRAFESSRLPVFETVLTRAVLKPRYRSP